MTDGPWRPSPLLRHFLINVAIGCFIEFVVIDHLEHTAFLEPWKNLGLDRVTRVSAALASPQDGSARSARPLVFIDVDDRTWRDAGWGGGEPAEAPRPELLKLVEFAFSSGAQVVVLDVLLERSNPTKTDTTFADDMKRLVNGTRERDARSAPLRRRLLLARGLLQSEETSAPTGSSDAENELPVSTLPPMVLDSLHDPAMEKKRFAVVDTAPLFVVSAGDRILRDWQMWSVACAHGELRIVPSVQLAAVAAFDNLATDGDAPWMTNANEPCPRPGLDAKKARDIADDRVIQWMRGQPLFIDHDVKHPSSTASRIVFRTPDTSLSPAFSNDGRSGVRRLSALDVLQRPALVLRTATDESWRQSIVVIGQSHRAANDDHLTPLGDMTGALVIVNSVDSLLRFGMLREPPDTVRHSIAAILVVLASYVMARWRSLLGTLVAALLVLLMAIPSLLFFRYGLWIDFTLPVLGVMLHEMYHYAKLRLPGGGGHASGGAPPT